ncbi:MAG: hypothetical protein ACPG32_09610 [Akkermansiaceae bacterium]
MKTSRLCLLYCLFAVILSPVASAKDTKLIEMARAFFTKANYAQALELAQASNYKQGTHGHDTSLFIKAGSHFYLGNFAKAQPLLDKHHDLYPQSKLAMHSMYFQGSNLTRLQKWDDAEVLLKDFLDEYKDPKTNIYYANALYDLANCSYTNNKLQSGIAYTKQIEKMAPNSVVIDMAYALRGNLEESLGNRDTAEIYYKKALKIAENGGNPAVAGESLSYLIGMLGAKRVNRKTNPRILDAIPYLDKMWKHHQNSPYLPQAVVFGRDAMKKAGRGDEQLKMLRAVIAKISQKQDPIFLEECINAYTDAFINDGGNLTDLEKLYTQFPGLNKEDQRTRSLLKLSLIGEMESQLQSLDGDKKTKLQATINRNFNQLAKLSPNDLSNFALLRVGDHLKNNAKDMEAALPFYMEVISRADNFGRNRARQEVGEILSQSTDPNKRTRGLAILEKICTEALDDSRARAKARYTIIQAHAKAEQWDLLEKQARKFLDEKHTRHAAEVPYLFALSFDKREMRNDALFYYSMVYSRYMGYLKISTPSVHRVCEILWQRNKQKGDTVTAGEEKKLVLQQSDRKSAISIGKRFLRTTKRIRTTNKKISDKEKSNWDKLEKLIQEYEKLSE